MKKYLVALLCILTLIVPSCGSVKSAGYTIAIDPSFFPLKVQGKEDKVYVFIHDLLTAIADAEGIQIKKINLAWDQVLESVREGQVDGAVSLLMPYSFNKEKYAFSHRLLHTGPALVVPKQSSIASLEGVKKGVLYVPDDMQRQFVMSSAPEIATRVYEFVPQVLDRVLRETDSAALVETIQAISYVNDLYDGRLKIAKGPIGQEGLRVITKKGENKELLERLNAGLDKLKLDGTYDRLAHKWSVLPK